MKTEKQLKEIWDRVPVGYYESGNFFQKLWHERKWKIVGSLIAKKTKRILDLGCANGYSTSQIKKFAPQAEISGVDISEKLISFAKKKYPQFKFVVANAENLPFPDKSFEMVVLTEVLEHLNSPQKVLGEIRRVLVPEGELILELDTGSPLFKFLWFFWSRFFKGRVWRHSHLHRFSVKSLEGFLKQNGFSVKKKIISHWGMAMTVLASKKKN